ncbi:MEKHLA domain-containing protein [Aureimonas leprariae]|uniref:MEKHLA domain-containing protein n=1 Tax=Plantimonas leprariae TaxID=2615207 RepID=A0A7V7PNK4_9HYPH|nr:MEKHLA domain-containing protein [Aureimonas leprariae]KAB0679350.1 MEKHLA domain-containing protein [Aureimonas leprariae]
MPLVPTLAADRSFFELLTGSFERLVGRPLCEPGRGPRWLYEEAAFVVLAHDTAADPVFVYANRAAEARFGYGWDEFTTLPSRLSAEPMDRAERQRLLDAVSRDGFIADYRGVRVTKFGRHFRMEDGVVWQLVDASGQRRGQAATFSRWTDLDG